MFPIFGQLTRIGGRSHHPAYLCSNTLPQRHPLRQHSTDFMFGIEVISHVSSYVVKSTLLRLVTSHCQQVDSGLARFSSAKKNNLVLVQLQLFIHYICILESLDVVTIMYLALEQEHIFSINQRFNDLWLKTNYAANNSKRPQRQLTTSLQVTVIMNKIAFYQTI